MADPASTAQRQQQAQSGFIVGLLTLPFRLVAVLLGSLLLNIVIECAGMYMFWPEEGWRHSQKMYEFELGQLSGNFKRSVLVQEPGRTARELVQTINEIAVSQAGVAASLSETARSRLNRQPRLEQARQARDYVLKFYDHVEMNLIAAAYAALVFIVRLLVLFLSLPLFIVAAFLGLIDGLVCRDVRRFGAGRESGYLYHRAKACVLPLATLPWLLYLAIPLSIEAAFILVPGAVCFGISIAITARSFKKYL